MSEPICNKPSSPVSAPGPSLGSVRSARPDILALVALGLILGLTCRGHFTKPHRDFYQFRETGRSLICGELPATFKRAPVYPILIAAFGSAIEAALLVDVGKHPDLLAAEWINALLLPLNGVLVFLIGRRWFGGAARWASVWFLVLPIGLFCTAHALAEPLLVATLLLTVLAVQRGSRWAYPLAALASMTRYDAAGLIAGLFVVDLLRSRRPFPAVARAALASVPLLIWLILTAATWRERSYDHYLSQIRDDPRFDPVWALATPLRCVFDYEKVRLRLPAPFAGLEPALRHAAAALPAALALVGAFVAVRRRDQALIVVLIAFAAYTLVHALFPFREFRFGYPLAPLILLAAGFGLNEQRERLERLRALLGRGLTLLLAVLLALLVWVVVRETEPFRLRGDFLNPWAVTLPVLAVLGVVVVWATPLLPRGKALSRATLLLAGVTLALVQIRTALPSFGWGANMANIVESARWIGANTRPEQRVLSAEPGVLRLYAGLEPRERFLGFEQMEAKTWPEIVRECRQRSIEYIIWHDQQFGEHGPVYAKKMGLARFDVLGDPAGVADDVVVERQYRNYPNLWIFRVLPIRTPATEP